MTGIKRRVYIETTVASYYTARPSRDVMVAGHQRATRKLWAKLAAQYETYVSALVYQEAEKGDLEQATMRLAAIKPFRMLDIDEEARSLAEEIIVGKGIAKEYPEDALHIAVAAVNGMEVLVTWNFAHLNNPFTRMMVRQIVENAGYACPEICSPEELLEVDR
jgi:predicted nucleic acid-binding protein